MGIQMPANFIFFICLGIVASTLGFIIYGILRGFGTVFKEDENPECKDHSCIQE